MRCPECAGEMKFDRYIHCYVCQRCGLALTRSEYDMIISKQKEYYTTHEDEADKRRREYLKWWLSEKKEK